MKASNRIRALLCVVAAVAVLTVFATMSGGGAGSQTDPLITLSYLNETFTAQIMDRVDKLLDQRNDTLAGEPSSGNEDTYAEVTLSAGQTLSGEIGCQILLRSGSARCEGTGATGLVDTTSGDSLDNGAALTVNHLYLMPESRSITTTDGAALLVRGSHTINTIK